MKHLRTLAILLVAAAPADAAIRRYQLQPKPGVVYGTRAPQFILADTAAELPTTDVGEGDTAYSVDNDKHWKRTGSSWVETSVSGSLEGDVEAVVDLLDLQDGAAACAGGQFVRRNAGDTAWECAAGGGGGAPTTSEYLVGALDGGLSAERLVTDTASVTWDLATAGQAKANVAPAGVTLAGDVDGAADANDLDEAAVEAELEAVLDLADMQGNVPDAKVDGSAEADELVLAGDVDGTANANDLDEAAVEAELEGVLDLADMQGTLPLAKLTDDASSGLCLVSGGAGGDPNYTTCPGGGGGLTHAQVMSRASLSF